MIFDTYNYPLLNTKMKMKKSHYAIVLAMLIIMSAIPQAKAQVVGKQFPDISTETAHDKRVSIPRDTRGKYTLLGMAFSKKSEDDLNTWMEPVYWKFIDKSSGGQIDQLFGNMPSSSDRDVNIYFIPMFTGVNAAATGVAKKKAVKNMDYRLLPYILFYKGSLKPYKDALDFQKKDIPYFFVLDERGKIVYATSGPYSKAKMDKVEEILE